MHDVLSQFAQEKAEAEPAGLAAAQSAHSRHYLGLLNREGERLHTTAYQAALDILRADMDNVHQAWLWSASRQEPAALTGGLGHLATYYESSGLPQEAATFLRRTLAVLEASGADPASALTAQIQYQIAASLLTAGQYIEALAASQAALKIARALENADLTNQIFINQSYIYREQGQYDETQAVLNEAIAYSRGRNDLLGVARALHAQGNTHWSMGEYEPARACYEAGRELYQQLGDETAVAVLTGNIGVVLWRQGQYHEALAKYEVALAAVRRIGNATRVAVWLGNIGLVYVDLQDNERALAYLNEGLQMHDQLGRTYYRIELLLGKATVLLRQGNLDWAAQLLKQATDLAYLIGNRTYLLDCDRLQAKLHLAQGRRPEAIQLLQSLAKRESRPDAAAAIAQELAQLDN
jgi:tetratricopeptide (TPR) repeat protein